MKHSRRPPISNKINKEAIMILKHIIHLFSLSIILCSCATTAKYTQKLNQDIGKTYDELISQYGTPSKTKRLNNGNMIVYYVNVNTELLPDPEYDFDSPDYLTEDEEFYPFTYGGNQIPVGSFMGETITNYCETKFYLTDNKVTSWSYKGNSCVAL